MKKNKIRLSLSRETLRCLAADQTANAVGGTLITTTPGCPLITATCFNCITQHTCPTRCGQNYC